MQTDYSLLVGSNGTIAKSGKTIYDSLHEGPGHLLPSIELEAILKRGLLGLDLNYPLRTRSKVLKTRICEILGYPVPASFKKTQPRFPAQDFDTYIQKSNNLQIWNQEIAPTRRYVIIRLDENSRVTGGRVVAGETLAELDTTGTLTKKYQAKSRETPSEFLLTVVSHESIPSFDIAQGVSPPTAACTLPVCTLKHTPPARATPENEKSNTSKTDPTSLVASPPFARASYTRMNSQSCSFTPAFRSPTRIAGSTAASNNFVSPRSTSRNNWKCSASHERTEAPDCTERNRFDVKSPRTPPSRSASVMPITKA